MNDIAQTEQEIRRDEAPPPQAPRVRLGEELPIFCERCGYSLHGLPQVRCGQCELLHFTCPECNHRQPINTLRPAFQRWFGRVKAFWLVLTVVFKLNWFGWLLFAWFAMGVEWSYSYNWRGAGNYNQWTYHSAELSYEILLAFGLFALAFGLFSRMLLLRWRHSVLVGAVLAALVACAVMLGAVFRVADLSEGGRGVPPISAGFYTLVGYTGLLVLLGVVMVWPVWVGFVRLFLPRRAGTALLEWQLSLSEKVSAAAPDGAGVRGQR